MSADHRPDLGRGAELADEQAALRRIATLVARGVPAADVFAAVADEVHRLLHPDITAFHRIDPDGRLTTLAICGKTSDLLRIGDRWHPGSATPGLGEVLSGRPSRMDHYRPLGTVLDEIVEAEHAVAWVASPVVLMGRAWGILVVVSRQGPLPAGTEDRLADFSELIATAIANAESRAQLIASRARIVAAADEARRRIQRDLHDGAQQRVVALALRLQALAASDAAEARGIDADLLRVAAELGEVLEDLRDISSGLHPAVLSQGGLEPALKALARRSPIPVALDVRTGGRLAEHVEVAAYYVVSEMLTNAAKHAGASRVDVTVEPVDGEVRVCIRDDGIGGADPAAGSGLIGLTDRIEALGGTVTVDSLPGAGTTLVARLPVRDAATTVREPASSGDRASG